MSDLKKMPTAIMASPITTNPAYMIGLRPSRSTRAMAMNVAKHIGQPDKHRAAHLVHRSGEPGDLENMRRVVHDHVDAGELLDDLQPHAEEMARRKLEL